MKKYVLVIIYLLILIPNAQAEKYVDTDKKLIENFAMNPIAQDNDFARQILIESQEVKPFDKEGRLIFPMMLNVSEGYKLIKLEASNTEEILDHLYFIHWYSGFAFAVSVQYAREAVINKKMTRKMSNCFTRPIAVILDNIEESYRKGDISGSKSLSLCVREEIEKCLDKE